MKNRFLTVEEELARPESRFVPRYGRNTLSATKSKNSKCTQFSEIDIEPDVFVLDVLEFFFEERLETHQLNDELRDIAARAVWKATDGSEAMDMVPRPAGTMPNYSWLIKEATQIAFRRAQNQCIYESVKNATRLALRSEYIQARDEIGISQSLQAELTASPACIEMIKIFEGFRENLYNDAANHCTIGYGHLVHNGPCNGTESQEFQTGITQQRATELLLQKLSGFEHTVLNRVTVALTQTQFDALTSFCFNIGSAAFTHSTLLRELNQGNYGRVPTELRRWIYADGEVLQGLVRRRDDEALLFAEGRYPANVSGEQSLRRQRVTPQTLQSLGLNLSDFEQPYAREFQAQVDWCQIRHSIIRSAVEIQGDWLTAGGNLKNENNADVLNMLIQFWRDGTGMTQQQAEATAALSAADHPSQAFWSAAFISWCVRNAMPNPAPPHNGGFHYHMRHMAYIAQACRNRENADNTRPFWLHDTNEANIVPEDGDILCLNRSGTSHSYQSVRQDWFVNNPNAVATGSSHTDIVVGHYEDNGRRWIETIGGNVGDTVGSRYYSLDAQGRLVDQVLLNGTPINNKTQVTQTVGARAPVVFALIRLTACQNFA